MKALFQLSVGLLSAMAMVAFVFGAMLLSLSEDAGFALAFTTPETTTSPTLAVSPVTPPPGITLVVSPSATLKMMATSTTTCQPPPGWRMYTVIAGDQIDQLAADAGISTKELRQANCMDNSTLLQGSLLYLPPEPTATATPVPTTPVPVTATLDSPITQTPTRPTCGPFPGWVLYTVRPGDTLFKLSNMFGVSIGQLQQANCMNGNLLISGTRIYVPYVPTATPTALPTRTPVPNTPTPTHTHTPAFTDTVVPPSETPTNTPTETPTETPTNTVETSMPTPIDTVAPVVP